MTDDDDFIAVADLPAPLRQYCKRAEIAVGRVSARELRARQLGHEGRVTQHARQEGARLYVADRTTGEKIATTAATVEIDTAAKVRLR